MNHEDRQLGLQYKMTALQCSHVSNKSSGKQKSPCIRVIPNMFLYLKYFRV